MNEPLMFFFSRVYLGTGWAAVALYIAFGRRKKNDMISDRARLFLLRGLVFIMHLATVPD